MGLISAEEAQATLASLRRLYEYEAYKELPIEIDESTQATDKAGADEMKQGIVYSGGFEPDMTRNEARLILGLKATFVNPSGPVSRTERL
jgi:hypothetical protein